MLGSLARGKLSEPVGAALGGVLSLLWLLSRALLGAGVLAARNWRWCSGEVP